MAKSKKETKGIDFQMATLREKIVQKDKDIKVASDRLKKEMELLEFHKNKVKKYTEDLKKLEQDKKCIRMDLMDLMADDAKIDRNKFFEDTMAAATKITPETESENKSDGASAPSEGKADGVSTSEKGEKNSNENETEEKSDSPQNESSDSNNNENVSKKDKVTPLDKARAEFLKKNPGGFSAVERSKR